MTTITTKEQSTTRGSPHPDPFPQSGAGGKTHPRLSAKALSRLKWVPPPETSLKPCIRIQLCPKHLWKPLRFSTAIPRTRSRPAKKNRAFSPFQSTP